MVPLEAGRIADGLQERLVLFERRLRHVDLAHPGGRPGLPPQPGGFLGAGEVGIADQLDVLLPNALQPYENLLQPIEHLVVQGDGRRLAEREHLDRDLLVLTNVELAGSLGDSEELCDRLGGRAGVERHERAVDGVAALVERAGVFDPDVVIGTRLVEVSEEGVDVALLQGRHAEPRILLQSARIRGPGSLELTHRSIGVPEELVPLRLLGHQRHEVLEVLLRLGEVPRLLEQVIEADRGVGGIHVGVELQRLHEGLARLRVLLSSGEDAAQVEPRSRAGWIRLRERLGDLEGHVVIRVRERAAHLDEHPLAVARMGDVLHRLLDVAVELIGRLPRERDVQVGVRERRILLHGGTEELVGFLGTCHVRQLLAGQKINPGRLVGGRDRNLGDLG